ncbi:MAG: hypothetical protein Q7J67_00645 [bacterium]|nr:hypothetical protein [bacterium]
MSKIKEFFCLTNDNNGFKLEILENPDDKSLCAELTRIENYLPRQHRGSDPISYMKYHDLEKIVGSNLDQIVANAKARIHELGFNMLNWKEEEKL